jgi:peptidoglycan/xylan/chitin deacetylase (PgdA/CDA1 family)
MHVLRRLRCPVHSRVRYNKKNSAMPKIRHFTRDVYARALYSCGASRLDRIPSGRLLILTLHRVLPHELREQYPIPELAVTPEELRWVLSCVVRHFAVDTVSRAYERLNSGADRKPLLALSFDDGQLDNFVHGVPILDEFGIKASFYVPTDYIGGGRLLWHDAAGFAWAAMMQEPGACRAFAEEFGLSAGGARTLSVEGFLAELKRFDVQARTSILAQLESRFAAPVPAWARLMTWEEIAALHKDGHEIGAHGRTHELLPHLDAQHQGTEIEGSRTAIEAVLGVAPCSFCYPNGSYDEQTLAAVNAAGYDNAVTTRWGMNETSSAALELLRCDLSATSLLDRHGLLSLPRLSLRLAGFQPGLGRFDGRLPATA